MLLIYRFQVAVLLLSAVLGSAQKRTPQPASVPKGIEAQPGILRLLSNTEADLDGGDSQGHPARFVFLVNKDTDLGTAKPGNTVNILFRYTSDGKQRIATAIVVVTTSTPEKPAEVGAQARVTPMLAPASPDVGTTTTASAAASINTSTQDSTGLQQSLLSQFTLTKTTADRSDILTAGSILVLQKDNLLMSSTADSVPLTNVYQNGRISQGTSSSLLHGLGGLAGGFSSASRANSRAFVAGEKFWVTGIDVRSDSVIFHLFSDPIDNVRYYTNLKFPFPRESKPSLDQIQSSIAQALKVQVEDSHGEKAEAAAAATQASEPIESTPTAAPAPATIALHQTKAEVVAALGPPLRIVKLATKEIYYYPDMKVTFVEGKVTDIQ